MIRTRLTMVVLVLGVAAVPSVAPRAQGSPQRALRAAEETEQAKGCPAAIEQYKKVSSVRDRAVAAMALVKLGVCYGKVGDTAASRKTFEQVTNRFGDQTAAVMLAQAGLGEGSAAGPRSRTIWAPASSPGGTTWGTLSRDGRFFSYSDGSDLLLHEVARGTDRNLTHRPKDSKDRPYESVISPDGDQVAYVWAQTNPDLFGATRYTVRVVNLAGNANPRVLFNKPDVYDVVLHDWSPDGRFLAVAVHGVDKTTVRMGLLSVSDGVLHPLKTLDWRGTVGWMAFSPDGRYLGYDRPRSDVEPAADVFVLAVDTTRDIPVVGREFTAVEHGSNDSMVGWSPDGKWLLFSSDRYGHDDLWAIEIADGKTQGTPRQLRADLGPGFRAMGWTPSGALYYQTKREGSPRSTLQLASIDVGMARYTSSPLGARGFQENTSLPVWSRDGESMAFVSEMRDRPRAADRVLVLRAMDTGKTRELIPKDLTIATPRAWTPDRHSLLVVGADLKGRSGLYRVDAETRESTMVAPGFVDRIEWLPDGGSFLTTLGTDQINGVHRVDAQTGEMTALATEDALSWVVGPPTLSKDGKVYYTRSSKPGAARTVTIVARNLTTGKETELIRRSSMGFGVNLSPDGQFIASSSVDAVSNSRVALLIPTSGGEVRELMRVPSEVKIEDLNNTIVGQGIGVLGWVGNGQLLLSETKGDGTAPAKLWLVSVSGGEPRRVVGDRDILGRAAVSVSPDGLHFVYAINEPKTPTTSEVSILENFLPKTAKK